MAAVELFGQVKLHSRSNVPSCYGGGETPDPAYLDDDVWERRATCENDDLYCIFTVAENTRYRQAKRNHDRRRLATALSRSSNWSDKKVIYFCRHAEAEHNVKEKQAIERAKQSGQHSPEQHDAAHKAVLQQDPSLRDARLSVNGRQQARVSGQKLTALFGHPSKSNNNRRRRAPFRPPDVVLVSPLRRALETATDLFYNSNMGADPPLFLAVEALREKRTGLECDERSSVVELRREFPHVNFLDVERGPPIVPTGEDNAAVRSRGQAFLDHRLASVPGDYLAIVQL